MWIYNGQVFTTHSDIRRAFKNTSFPAVITDEILEEAGVLPVVQTAPPEFDPVRKRAVSAVELDGDDWVLVWTLVDLSPGEQQAEIDRRVAEKHTQIESDFEAEIAVVRAGYHPDEIHSWAMQQSGAAAVQDGKASDLLTVMAAARGITAEELASRIQANADAYAQIYGEALGRMQKRKDLLDAIDTDGDVVEQLEAI